MNKVGFIFDSTAVIADDLIEEYGFVFVPLNVTLDGVTYVNADVYDEEYMEKFLNSKKISTSSPSPQQFLDTYKEELAKGYEDIIVLPLSSKLSSTYQSALMARDMLGEKEKEQIHVLDTLNASIGYDTLFESLRDDLKNDLSVEELIAKINHHNENSMVIFEVEELKYLHNGGRLGKISYYVGDFLKIKPVIRFREGYMKVIATNRSRHRNVELILNKIVELIENQKEIFINYFHFGSEATTQALQKITSTLKEKFSNIRIKEAKCIDPVFMSHVGVKGFGLSVCAYNN